MSEVERLRTPDERFGNLPDFSYPPSFVTLPDSHDLRMHFVDVGAGRPVFLCLHGQPSWSYLYRHMIPVFAEAGRVVAPDLIGFGRSDKPVDEAIHSFTFHRNALLEFIDVLDLTDITLVCQDWGGILGLTLPMARPHRFSRLLVMNTALTTGEVPLGPGFEAWRAFNDSQPDLDVAALMKAATPILTEPEAAAYAAPFPGARYKAAVRSMPNLVPVRSDDPGAAIARQARDWWRNSWTGESFMAVGAQDQVVTLSAMESLRSDIRGCPAPMIVEDAGHFVQEWGEPIARGALMSFRRSKEMI